MTREMAQKSGLIVADASKISGANFLRMLTDRPLRTVAEEAEAEARAARINLFSTIKRAEYALANRERREIFREGQRSDETYDQYFERVNEPFDRAAERVRNRIAEYGDPLLKARRAA